MFFRAKENSRASLLPVWLTAAGVALLKALFLLLTPMRGIASTTWIIDDSFIEMRVARNLALGSGFSLDGVHPTTGAPFFWIYLTSLNHLLLGADAAIRATLMESMVLGTLATIVIFFLALKLTQDRRVAWTAFLLSTLTGNAFFNTMNGMDTAIFTLFALASIAAFFDVGRPRNWSALAWGCVTGLALGLTCMTRGDGIFVAFGLLAYRAYEVWGSRGKERTDLLRSMGGVVLVWAILFAIFMGWQLAATGSPFPANQVGRRGLSLALHGFSFTHFSLSQYLRIVVWNVFQLEELLRIAMGSALLALVAWGAGLLSPRLRPLAIVTALYLGIFFTVLVAYQWYFPDLHGLRYINPGVHLLFLFVAFLLWQLPSERGKVLVVAFLTASIMIVASYKHYQLISRLPWDKYQSYIGRPDPVLNEQFWAPIDWMRDHLPAGTLVGVRDYGRVSMFTDVAIQDLAGNIDPAVAVALENGTLKDYLRERKVQYLFIPAPGQRPDPLYKELHSKLSLSLAPGAPKGPFQSLYKIRWR